MGHISLVPMCPLFEGRFILSHGVYVSVQYGNAIHQLKTVKEILEGLKESGMELVGFKDCSHEGDKPWYETSVIFAR